MTRRASCTVRGLVATLLLFAAGPVAAELQIDETVRLYTVNGADLPTLIQRMNRLGPVSDDGTPRWGITRYHLGWEFQHRRDAQQCRAEPLTVRLRLKTVLPSWEQRDQAPADQQANWAVLSRALAAHEEGHVRIAKECANALLAALEKLPASSDCEQMRSQLRVAGEAELDRCDARHQEYDHRTRNGYLQGLNIQ